MRAPLHTFEFMGCTALSYVEGLDSAAKVSPAQKEAAYLAHQEVAKKRLIPELFIFSHGQVVAIPDPMFDLADRIAVVDVRGVEFDSRENRTGRV